MPTTDEILNSAGIQRARAIITTLPNDADNVFISLTARELNPNIKIIARASDEKSGQKLRRAGANHVVMPDALGGLHMAQIITKPYVIELLNVLNNVSENEYILEEITYGDLRSEFRNKSLRELDFRNKTRRERIGHKRYMRPRFDLHQALALSYRKVLSLSFWETGNQFSA